jgi:hypothetical protein
MDKMPPHLISAYLDCVIVVNKGRPVLYMFRLLYFVLFIPIPTYNPLHKI